MSGPRITADKFAKGIAAFVAMIKDVAKHVSGTSRGVQWTIGVRPGSAMIDCTPLPSRAPATVLPTILDTIERGVISTEAGSACPPHFSEKALNDMRKLASVLEHRPDEVDLIRVWRNGRSHQVTTQTVANVDAIHGIASRDWGTIEGRLQMITEVRRLRFVVRDAVTARLTECFFDDDIIDDVTSAFGKRVSVSGVILYRANGDTKSIEVEEFSVMPDEDELPDIDDMIGILQEVD